MGLSKVVVAGFGSEDRHDDGVGAMVAERAANQVSQSRYVGPLCDPLDLLGEWNGADLVIVVDALHSGAPVGSLHTLEVEMNDVSRSDGDALTKSGESSTHGLGLVAVLRLARALGQAPRRLVVVGIEGERFDLGRGLSDDVEAAVPNAVQRVVNLMREAKSCA
ncbi:MAG: hydrogenase maturation protease [Acidimicrobiales bacterium]